MTKSWGRHFDSHPAKRTTAKDVDFLGGHPSSDDREVNVGGSKKMEKRKKKQLYSESSEVLGFLRSLAIGHWNQIQMSPQYLDRVLLTRTEMFLKVEDLQEDVFGTPVCASSITEDRKEDAEPLPLDIDTTGLYPVPVLYEPSNLMTDICLNRARHFDNHPASGNAKRMRSIEVILSELSDQNEPMGRIKRKKEESEDLLKMLGFLKKVTVGQWDEIEDDDKYKHQVLAARKAMFLSIKDVSDPNDFPYLKKKKPQVLLHTSKLFLQNAQMKRCGPLGSCSILNQPRRRSGRTLLKIGETEIPRKRIPVGSAFQVDVPDWTGPPTKEQCSNDSRWLGTKIWPMDGDDRQFNEETIGKGRTGLCVCSSPGSVACVRFHVKMARCKLKSELGPAFSSLGFDDMGEEVSMMWIDEDQMMFGIIVQDNPTWEGKSFLGPLLEYFASTSRQELINFYYNVYVLRWMRSQTRLTSGAQDSDNENMMPERDSDDKDIGQT